MGLVQKTALLFMCVLLVSACHPRVPPPVVPGLPERHFATTPDGWQLALHRYPPCFRGACLPEVKEMQRDPVLLVHGLACNHYFWDLTERSSFARYLSDRGFDVWMLELRGHGDSVWPPGSRRQAAGWTLTDHALVDAPTAVRYIRELTGAPRVDWVGHSMGGMIAYMYLSSKLDSSVGNVVTLGSPGSITQPNPLVAFTLRRAKVLLLPSRIPVRPVTRAWSRVGGKVPADLDEVIWHLPNLPKNNKRLMMWVGLENVERGVSRSLSAIYEEGHLVSADKAVDFSAHLERFQNPLLAVAAPLDGLAPSHTVLDAFRAVSSRDKTYLLLSAENGCASDYGHVDMILGERSKEEVFPMIWRWLEDRQER